MGESGTIRTIRVHEFMSLDGVIDEPKWTFEYGFDPRMGEAIGGVMSGCAGILLGRRTYDMFEPAWSKRSADDDPGAPFMNETTKYVVSSTLRYPKWKNTEVLPYSIDGIRRVTVEAAGDLYVSGSGQLVRSMIADGLLGELHLFVYPTFRGTGPRLFPEGEPGRLSLLHSETYDNGVLYLAYRFDAGNG
jgi:dihydrofolate reductase